MLMFQILAWFIFIAFLIVMGILITSGLVGLIEYLQDCHVRKDLKAKKKVR